MVLADSHGHRTTADLIPLGPTNSSETVIACTGQPPVLATASITFSLVTESSKPTNLKDAFLCGLVTTATPSSTTPSRSASMSACSEEYDAESSKSRAPDIAWRTARPWVMPSCTRSTPCCARSKAWA